MALPEASAPAIFRAAQKDEYFVNQLNSSASEVLRLFGNIKWHKYSKYIPVLSYLTYNSITTLRDLQTLGEEYTGILQVDNSYVKLPSKGIQLIYIILGAFGETFLRRILQRLKDNVTNSEELLPKPKRVFLKLISITVWSLPILQEMHQAVFFMGSRHYHLAKRATGVNYIHAVPGRRPRVGTLRPLGVPYFLRAILTGVKTIPTFDDGADSKETTASDVERNFAACPGCLEDNSTPSALPCGHIFCNTCSRTFKSCAVCRAPYLTHRVVPLQNYTLKIK